MTNLGSRKENCRDKRTMPPQAVAFSLQEIKRHFDDNLAIVLSQGTLAKHVTDDDRCMLYRAQIVFLEGALDFYLHEISKYGVVQIYKGDWPETDAYNNLKFTMECLKTALGCTGIHTMAVECTQ